MIRSAEYVVQGLRRHKLVAVIALAGLIGAGILLAHYLVTRKAATAIDSIAVMPFINASGNADVEYLSDRRFEGLADECWLYELV